MDIPFSALAAALLAMVATWLLLGAFSRRKQVMDEAGNIGPEKTDIEKLLAPFSSRLQVNNRERLVRELAWAGINMRPETWRALNLVLAPAAAIGAISFVGVLGLDVGMGGLLAIFCGIVGFFYPRSYKSSRVRKRAKAINEDVPAFISLYARLFASLGSLNQTARAMSQLALRERKIYFDDNLTPDERRRFNRMKGHGPYDSELWSELIEMVRRAEASNYWSAGATLANPDPLLRFGIEASNEDLSRFINQVRQNQLESTQVTPAMLDDMVKDIQDRRINETKASFARLLAKATVFLVSFNMPLLLIAAVAPTLYALLSGGGH